MLSEIEETLKPRMFANLLEEATEEICDTLDKYHIELIARNEYSSNDELLDAFISAKASENKSMKTIVRYTYVIHRFLKAVNLSTRTVTAQAIRGYFENEMNRGISPGTIKGIRECLSSYYGWLMQSRLIKFNPVAEVKPIKVPMKVRPCFSAMDIEKIRLSGLNLRDSALINFLLSTACRVSEVCDLDIKDINIQNDELKVFGKGSKERKTYLDEIALVTLKEYLASRNDDNPALFVTKFGRRMTPHCVRAMLYRISKRTGIENLHPHRFRRTQITRLINHGMPIQNVSLLAGHSKIDTTMKYYYASEENIKADFRRYSY